MDEETFEREYQKVLEASASYWDGDLHKKLVKEYTNNGSADMGQLYGLLHGELAQYANTLVGTALKHFLVDDHSSKKD